MQVDATKGTLACLANRTCDARGALKLGMCDDDETSELRLWLVRPKGKMKAVLKCARASDAVPTAASGESLLVFSRDAAFVALLTLKNAAKHVFFLWRGGAAPMRTKVLLGMAPGNLAQTVIPTLGDGRGATSNVEQEEEMESPLFLRALSRVAHRHVVVVDGEGSGVSAAKLPRVIAVHAGIHGEVCGREVSSDVDASNARPLYASRSYAILVPSSGSEEDERGGFAERYVWHGALASAAQRALACEIAAHPGLGATSGKRVSLAPGAPLATTDISACSAVLAAALALAPGGGAAAGAAPPAEAASRPRLFKVDHKRFTAGNPHFVMEEESPIATPMLDPAFCFLLETGRPRGETDVLAVWRGADAPWEAEHLALQVGTRCVSSPFVVFPNPPTHTPPCCARSNNY